MMGESVNKTFSFRASFIFFIKDRGKIDWLRGIKVLNAMPKIESDLMKFGSIGYNLFEWKDLISSVHS